MLSASDQASVQFCVNAVEDRGSTVFIQICKSFIGQDQALSYVKFIGILFIPGDYSTWNGRVHHFSFQIQQCYNTFPIFIFKFHRGTAISEYRGVFIRHVTGHPIQPLALWGEQPMKLSVSIHLNAVYIHRPLPAMW